MNEGLGSIGLTFLPTLVINWKNDILIKESLKEERKMTVRNCDKDSKKLDDRC
jgi:hypothetical protein